MLFSATRIDNPRPNEHVVFFLRRHPIVFLKPILLFVIQCAVGIGLALFLYYTFPDFLNISTIYAVAIILGSAYALLTWLLFFYGFLDYYLDTSLVTNVRIINTEQNGLFSRVHAEQYLDRIQDVTSEIKGLFPTLFHYGTVYVQTAGAQERVTMEQVPNPDIVAQKLLDLIETNRHAKIVN
ncbi:PH domain-containing protein [Candidatus Uhrbacteria bacterium]|nr:PH domain-containing protein [Candidatus Uhrbacteria bacterium]